MLVCMSLVFLAYDLGRMVGRNQIRERINDRHNELTRIVIGLIERAEQEEILSKEEAVKIKKDIMSNKKI